MNEMPYVYTILVVVSCIFLFSILPYVSSADVGDETDRLALLSVKEHITSDPHQILPLWNDSIHFCNWTGIECGRRHQRVVSIDLRSGGFSGSISPAIGNLTFLRELLLYNNSFTGNIPHDVVCKWRYRKKASTETSSENENFPLVSYRSLHEATDGFSSSNLIGSGKFGFVYKAILMQNGPQVVAVKVLKLAVDGADMSFLAECEASRSIRHRNLVKVVTSCSTIDFQGNDFKALVYRYMVNGSLEDWLHQNRVVSLEDNNESSRYLNFLQRLNIAIDMACALDYIHRQYGSPLVHCDLKPSNVLLDEDLVAHLGDFGSSRFLRDSSTSHPSSLGIKGTIGYAAPEYGMGSEMSTYGDIYSFGILVMELFTGYRPTDDMFGNGMNLHSFVKTAMPEQVMEITDRVIFETNGVNEECLTSVYQIGIACSMELPRDRMDMSNVFDQLQVVKKTFLEGMTT